jgi:hypothetical protein
MFWMVLGVGTPTYKHTTLESAKTEAERLARACPGDEFTVLQSIATVKKSDISWDIHDEEYVESPF